MNFYTPHALFENRRSRGFVYRETSTPGGGSEDNGPSKEVKDLLEGASGPARNPVLFDPEKARDSLDERYQNLMGEMRDKHDEWNQRGIHNLHRIRRWNVAEIRVIGTSSAQYKEWIKDQAAQRAEQKFKEMGELTRSRGERLNWHSLKTARTLAELTSRVEVSSDVLEALEAERENYRAIYDSFRRGMEALRAEHPIKTRIPWGRLNRQLADPFSAKEYERITQVAREVRDKAKERREAYLESSAEEFKNLHTIDTELRQLLLNYDPELIDRVDELLAKNAIGEGDLEREINHLFWGSNILSHQRVEQKALIQMARKLQPSKGRRAEIFYRLANDEVHGRGDKVLPDLMKLRLGAPVLYENKGKKGETRVWATGKGREMVLREVATGRKFVLDKASGKAWEIKNAKATDPAKKYRSFDLKDVTFTVIHTQV